MRRCVCLLGRCACPTCDQPDQDCGAWTGHFLPCPTEDSEAKGYEARARSAALQAEAMEKRGQAAGYAWLMVRNLQERADKARAKVRRCHVQRSGRREIQQERCAP